MRQKRHKKARLLTMDELHARPCEVDGRPALFHRWIEEDDALLQIPRHYTLPEAEKIMQLFREDKVFADNCKVVVTHHTFALVEYRNGTIAKVEPERIQFTEKEGQA